MKNRNHTIRIIILLILGFILMYLAYLTKYTGESILIFMLLAIVGMIFWVWQISKDEEVFGKENKLKSRISVAVGFILMLNIVFIFLKTVSLQNAPWLIEIYEATEYIGTSIDFKKDKTYILKKHHLMGLSDYEYGRYELEGNLITLDKKHDILDGKTMLIQPIQLNEYEIKSSNIRYIVVETDGDGNQINNIKYNVIQDNR